MSSTADPRLDRSFGWIDGRKLADTRSKWRCEPIPDHVRRLRSLERVVVDAMPASVLIIEDDEPLRDKYVFMLALAGFEVREARSGYEALQQIERRRPDLLVLDVTLPGIAAEEVSAEIAADPDTTAIPVVVLARELHTSPASWNGAACVLVKPVSPSRLLDAVKRCLGDAAGST